MTRGHRDGYTTTRQKPIGPGTRKSLMGAGAVLSLASLHLTIDQFLFHLGARQAEGQRVRIERDGSRYIAVVRYDVDGKAYEIKSGGYQYLNPELRLAGPVPVLYRPDRPESGRIATPIESWGWPVLLAVMGVAFVAVGRSRTQDQRAAERRGRRSGQK